jgi:KaiC/GvpD/RAD55 family RecA-like ATPase
LTPHQENPLFLYRADILNKIESHLDPAPRVKDEQCVFALCGLGGMGKTQIALEYAFSSLSKFKVILWVPADSREEILARYIVFAVELGLAEPTDDDHNKAKDAVKEWFENSRMLISLPK